MQNLQNNEAVLNARILIVDDQASSIILLESILKKTGFKNIVSLSDSRIAIDTYNKIHPDLLILDLNMPYVDGFEIMAKLKEIEEDAYLPIVVLSGEEHKDIQIRALDSGAKDFINKPYDRVEVIVRIKNLIEVRLLHNQIKGQNKTLEEKVKIRTEELYQAQLDLIQKLSLAVEWRDSETGLHTTRMSNYAYLLAQKANLSAEECDLIAIASPLHDIGKIGIPDRILLKPGKLVPEEWNIMKTHTTIGGQLLSGSDSKFLQMGKEIALSHHEKWDGSGYPRGLKGEDIPITGRICGISDVFDALTSVRPYKAAWPVEQAIEEIRKCGGSHFDPVLTEIFLKGKDAFITIMNKYKDINDTTPKKTVDNI